MEENVVIEPAVPEKKASDTIKKIVTSKPFLFVVICSVVSLVLQIIQAAQSKSFLTEMLVMIEEMGEGMGMSIESLGLGMIVEIADTIDTALFIFALIGLLPIAALTVGYCLFYVGGIKKDNKLISYACYCVLGFAIFNMIMPILYLVLILVGAILLISLEVNIGIVIVVALILAIPFLIILTYYQKLCSMLVGVTLTLKHDKNLLIVEPYVITCGWICAIWNIITALPSITSNFVGFLGSVISAACLIIVTRMFSQYKNAEGVPSKDEMKAFLKKK